MIQNAYKDSVEAASEDVKITGFNIEVNESMFQMLTSNVYNDIKLAVMREWSTNACDACIDADKDVVYDVHLPTLEESFFSVRDFGTGLSPDDIVGLFSNLGASTKRGSNKFNGTLGIGRMAGLAVADSFSVDSFYEGNLHSYVVSMQKGIPVTAHLGSTPTDQPNGLKLSVEVPREDINVYQLNATELYKYFDHKPNLNVENVSVELDVSYRISDDWFISRNMHNSSNYVVMSQIAYEIPANREILDKGFSGLVMKVPPGSVTFNPGRESLSLNKSTIETVNNLFEKVSKEYSKNLTSAVAACDSDLEVKNTFLNAVRGVPKSVVEGVKLESFMSDQFNALVESKTRYGQIDENYFKLSSTTKFSQLTNYAVSLSVRMAGYVTAKPLVPSSLTVNWKMFFNATHVIIDVKTGFRKALNEEFSSGDLITWIRCSDVDIETSVEESKSYLDAMGINYELASEVISRQPVEDKTSTGGTVPRQGLYVARYTSAGRFTAGYRHDNPEQGEYVYANLIHTDPVVENSDYYFCDYMELYEKLKQIREGKGLDVPKFYGVAKKYKKIVEGLDNWTSLEDFLKAEVKKNIFVDPLDVPKVRFSSNIINGRNLDKYPKEIQAYYTEMTNYASFERCDNLVPNSNPRVRSMLVSLDACFVSYTPTEDVDMAYLEDVFKWSMPKLDAASRSYNCSEEEILDLVKMEEFYALHKNV